MTARITLRCSASNKHRLTRRAVARRTARRRPAVHLKRHQANVHLRHSARRAAVVLHALLYTRNHMMNKLAQRVTGRAAPARVQP
jgi:hypothetical protein